MVREEDHPFALCLTHDVDRVYKTYQSLYYAVTDRDPRHLLDLLPGRNPYWQFEEVMALEADLGVRSAFYVLDEQHLFRDRPVGSWLDPEEWKLFAGRYSLDDPAVERALDALDAGGWEIGLHGSYDSYHDPGRLRREKSALAAKVDQPIRGGRQHYLNLDRPATWRHHADVGLRYDATLGSTDDFGFQHGYEPLRPFDDEFVVFPLTLMEAALPDVESDPETAWCHCLSLLEEAKANGAVMTVLWHPARFNEAEYPNYRTLYRRLVERALDMGAWVGPPGELYRAMDHPTAAATTATPAAGPGAGSTTADGIEADRVATDGATPETVAAERTVDGATADGGVAVDPPDGNRTAGSATDSVAADAESATGTATDVTADASITGDAATASEDD